MLGSNVEALEVLVYLISVVEKFYGSICFKKIRNKVEWTWKMNGVDSEEKEIVLIRFLLTDRFVEIIYQNERSYSLIYEPWDGRQMVGRDTCW